MRSLIISLLTIVLGSTLPTPGFADPGSNYGGSRLSPFKELIDAKKFDSAIDKLQVALKESPEDADLLNLLAYSQRNLQRYDEALANYLKALKIDPEHRGANEYLGELYLQLGQLEQAQERLRVLDDDCFFGCRQYDNLEKAIEKYQREHQP